MVLPVRLPRWTARLDQDGASLFERLIGREAR